MRNLIVPILLILVSCTGTTQSTRGIVSGYYPGWRWYDRGKLVRPDNLDYSKYQVINYAFLDVTADGSLRLTDPFADKSLLLGPINYGKAPAGYDRSKDLGNPAYHRTGRRFSDYAHKHRVKFVVSIGGWMHSGNFSTVAATPVKRAQFAAQCARIVRLYNLDGIDIDWEYPGDEARGGQATDRQNFTLLLQQVRKALDGLEPQLGRQLLLSIACGASPKRIAGIDWPQVSPLVDNVNLMSYSFYGHWDRISNHNAPLFPPRNATQPGYSCSEAVQNLLDWGVPADRVSMGLAFYGRTQLTQGTSGLHVHGLGLPDSIAFSRNGATPSYFEIVKRINEGMYYYRWDEVAQVPYLSGKEGIPSFVSFDDPQSITLKAQFAKSRNLHGVVIWDITADYLETSPGSKVVAETPLANAVKAVFSTQAPAVPAVLATTTICIFPNPSANGYLQIFTSAVDRARTNLAIYTTNGEKIHADSYTEATHRLDISALPAGPYLVQVQRGNEEPVLVRVVKQ
ncbi:MAG: T9SS type A sorting domain-containing protein [Bacteroidetes bacterium]|nr:MAG: T9SS type A sorting domain-containing protein [Bacteroidota bacterium]